MAVPRMLLGIRDRVEGRRFQPLALQAIEIAVWLTTLLELTIALTLILAQAPMVAGMGNGALHGAAGSFRALCPAASLDGGIGAGTNLDRGRLGMVCRSAGQKSRNLGLAF